MSVARTPADTVRIVDLAARRAAAAVSDPRVVVFGAFDGRAPIARYSICIRVDGCDGDLPA